MAWLLVVTCLLLQHATSLPLDDDFSLVVSTTMTTPTGSFATPEEDDSDTSLKPDFDKFNSTPIEIYQMHVETKVTNRYAYTNILSKLRNIAREPKEAIFSIVLPDTAFISGFTMEIDGSNYTAYVQEKEEAKKTYDQAIASGLGAAHVAASARDSNRFTVSVNIEPQTKATFYLIYEELLKRQDNHYELVINLHPGQLVEDLLVVVVIAESRKIIDVKAPPLRSGNEIGDDNAELDPKADVKIFDDKSAVVTFSPTLEYQKKLAGVLGTKADNGLSGQFIVQYDVERDPSGGDVLVQDGYFVHFFAPTELKPLPKYVVFILDTSSSMHGSKIAQLREAMLKILEQLNEQDIFSLVEFNSNVKVWDLYEPHKSAYWPRSGGYHTSHENSDESLFKIKFPGAYQANADNLKKAKASVSSLTPTQATDIYSALKVGLYLVELDKSKSKENNHQPLIIFLTDGDPTVGIQSTSTIIDKITEFNSDIRKSVIFTLSFGNDADKTFLQKLAAGNLGFSRHIYEAADASLQLQNFYKQISSPLLSNVTFKYQPSVVSLTETEFPIHYGGAEIVVAGFSDTRDMKAPYVLGLTQNGLIKLNAVVQRAVTSIERLWAYLTVKQLLDKSKSVNNTEQVELRKKALELALQYRFVTSVSSLVVVKPNATNTLNTETAEKGFFEGNYDNRFATGDSGGALTGIHQNSPLGPSFDLDSAVDIRIDAEETTANIPSFTTPSQPIISSTVSTSTIPTTRLPTLHLFESLPWLWTILKNGRLNLDKGKYLLGSNETITDVVDCMTPLNRHGNCMLLHSCRHIHSFLISKEKYEEYFCELRKQYAGVCCPDMY